MRKDFEGFIKIFNFIKFTVFLFVYQSFCLELLHMEQQENKNNNLPAANIQKICDGNRFEYISSFGLGRQSDLSRTFQRIQKNLIVPKVTFSDRRGREYIIFGFKPQLRYYETKQLFEVKDVNILNITGGYIRITYDFQWEKIQLGAEDEHLENQNDSAVQLGTSVFGNGTGVVATDSITFQKILRTNKTQDLQWFWYNSSSIKISNSLNLGTIEPFNQIDYTNINLMLANSSNSSSTLKNELISALNLHFLAVLKQQIQQEKVMDIQKSIEYIYNDYRGEFNVDFSNRLLNNSLTKNGLGLIYSQVIRNNQNFQCGQKVPDEPFLGGKYGGTQEFISNKLLSSTLIYALRLKFLDSTLSQENWQSRAFQFFMGDFHDVMLATKNISSFKQLNGKCQSMDDKAFAFNMKTNSSYSVLVNFTCVLQDNVSKIFDLIMPVEIEIQPKITSKTLDFVIKDIKGTPSFNESFPKYKITNQQLANFILIQTLNTAKKSTVIGSGYRVRNRKVALYQVRQRYLFLYDKV